MIARSRNRFEAFLFLFLFFCAAYFRHPVEYDNSLSRFFLLGAVVDDGTLAVDRNGAETVDVSRAGGHVYSNKAIGAPLLAVPAYYALRRWTPVRGDAPLSPRARYLCILAVSAFPFALAGVAMMRLLLVLGAGPRSALAATLAYGLGTLAWLHASLFSGHQTAASLALISFALLRSSGRGLSIMLAAGALAGFSLLSDYTALLIAAGLTVYVWTGKNDASEKGAFAFGLAAVAALWPAYNLACFGSPWTLSYARLAYPAFAAGAGRGLWGVGLPRPGPLLQLLFSPARGLFFTMPVLLLAPSGLWAMGRRLPRETYLIAGLAAAYPLALSGFYGWHGGWAFGPRYLVPMLPFLALPIAFSPHRRWLPPLLALSFLQVFCAQAVVPDVTEWVRNPIVETMLPLLRRGYGAVGWGQSLGLSALGSTALFAALAAAGAALLARELGAPEAPEVPRGGWSWFYPCACAAIVAALAFVRSPPGVKAHQFNARLLRDAARELRSPALNRAALVEESD
jgi:hypothetical protein